MEKKKRLSIEIMLFLCPEIMDDWLACCYVRNGCLANVYVELDGYVVYIYLGGMMFYIAELSSFVVIERLSAIFDSESINNPQFQAFALVD